MNKWDRADFRTFFTKELIDKYVRLINKDGIWENDDDYLWGWHSYASLGVCHTFKDRNILTSMEVMAWPGADSFSIKIQGYYKGKTPKDDKRLNLEDRSSLQEYISEHLSKGENVPVKQGDIKPRNNDKTILSIKNVIRYDLEPEEAAQQILYFIKQFADVCRCDYSKYIFTKAPVYEEPDYGYMIIKIRQDYIDKYASDNGVSEWDARAYVTMHSWKVKNPDIDKYPYVLSVTRGIVRAVYEVSSWNRTDDGTRYYFEGKNAKPGIRNHFLNKRLPEAYTKKGMKYPVLYSKNGKTE